jgi:2-polyprenyl-6-methoxyphenol hydroxylase-like FAD-dependent oxidoreductase
VSTARTRVVVVGAGIGGLASALLLARTGASVTLLERHSSSTAVGAGLLLQPNGLAVLSGLGLGSVLHRQGHRMAASRVHDRNGRPVAVLATPDFGHGLDHVLAIRRSCVHEVLEEAVAAQPGIVVRRGAEVTGASPAGSVDLRGPDRPATLAADLVVGADGVHSTVRSCADFGTTLPSSRRHYLRGLVPAGPPDEHLDGEYWTPLGLFGGARVDASTTYFYASVAGAQVARAVDAADLPALRRAWTAQLAVAGRVLERVGDFGDLLVNEVVRVDCLRWHRERVVLLGDAAHAMAPTLGQGANSALVDAAVLADELSRPGPLDPALERYAARRRVRVRRVQDRADTLTRVAHLTSPGAGRARDAVLRTLGRLPGGAARTVRAAQQEDPDRLLRTVRALCAGAA